MSDKPWPPKGAVHRVVTIVNQKGLHARAAAAFAKTAGRYKAAVLVRRGEHTVSGLSIMGLMMLAAAPGTEIEIAATGADAEAAVAALENLVALRFGED
ncbi:MAG: HPr family phosphocarrier protein [Alphaproteobacteria bacterium]|nr:HPr family phosphocarrier protein [Alphaproteobacteria bacterium]